MRLIAFLVIMVCGCSHREERTRSHPQLVVLEADGAFGSQAVTTASSPRTFTVRPSGTGSQFDRVESIESTCPEFQVTAAGLPAVVERTCVAFEGGGYGGGGEVTCVAYAEQPYTFTVRFAPIVELPSSDQCRIIVRLDGGASKSIPVSGTGIAPPLRVDISPRATVDFFTVNLNTESTPPRTITLRNTGSQALTVSSIASTSNGVFEVAGGSAQPHSIPPGGSELYQVTCTPPTTDAFTGSLTIATNDPDPEDAQVVIPFACQGIDHPIQNKDAPEVVTLVGSARTVTVELVNLSQTEAVTNLAIELQQPALPGLAISQAPATTVAAAGSTTVELTWNPPEPYKGALGGLILSIDGKPPRVIGIAMAHARVADVTSNIPANEKLDFGRVCIGDSKSRVFKMQPGGTDANIFADYAITGATQTGPFTTTVTPSTVQVSPPSEVEVEVVAMPAISDGTFDGIVTITTDSPNESTYDVPVVVEALQGGTTVFPPLLDFRQVVVTGFSDTKTATFTNCTAGDIEITGIALDGDSAADFDLVEIAPQLPPFTLPRGGEVTIAIQMLPRSDGTKQAQVGIDYQELGMPTTSEETVALLGEGFVRLPDRDSYYRCSTGTPLHAAPLALVLGFIVLRRRRRR